MLLVALVSPLSSLERFQDSYYHYLILKKFFLRQTSHELQISILLPSTKNKFLVSINPHYITNKVKSVVL